MPKIHRSDNPAIESALRTLLVGNDPSPSHGVRAKRLAYARLVNAWNRWVANVDAAPKRTDRQRSTH